MDSDIQGDLVLGTCVISGSGHDCTESFGKIMTFRWLQFASDY